LSRKAKDLRKLAVKDDKIRKIKAHGLKKWNIEAEGIAVRKHK